MQARGIALVVTLIALALFSALGVGLVLTTSTERLTGANFRDAVAALNAADGALELALSELERIEDWDPLLAGATRSELTDGLPSGTRRIGETTIDLTKLTNEITCGRASPCSDVRVRESTSERPWGANNPRWQPFLYGRWSGLIDQAPATADAYVVVWVGDDARETDGDPFRDGGAASGAGRDVVRLRAEAFGAGSGRRAVEADAVRLCSEAEGVRTCAAGIHVQSWRVRTAPVP